MKHWLYEHAQKLLILSFFLSAPLSAQIQKELNAPSTEFQFRVLSVEEGRLAFVDESIEPYFSVLQALEIAALTGNSVQKVDREDQLVALRRQARSQLQAQVSAFTPSEAALLEKIVMRIDDLLGGEFPLIAAQPWKLLKLDSTCCATAHTRSDSIILAQHGMDELMRLWEKSHDIDKVLAARGSVLLHEQVHIIQRYHPELFTKLYQKLWGFVHIAPVREGPWMKKHTLHNPDAYDLGFLLAFDSDTGNITPTRYYQLRTLLLPQEPSHPRMGKDFKSLAIETEKIGDDWHYKLDNSGKPVYIPFEDFKAFVHPLEGVAPQIALERGGDHPHEIIAYSFEAILLNRYLDIPTDNPSGIEVIERTWRLARQVLQGPL